MQWAMIRRIAKAKIIASFWSLTSAWIARQARRRESEEPFR
jgi:hypothetical protein